MGDRQYRKEERGVTGLLVESSNCRLPTIQAITRGDVRHVIHFSGYRVCPQANPGDTGRHSHRGPSNRRCLHHCPTCLRVAGGSTRQHGLASGKLTVTLPPMLLFPALPADKRWQTYRTTDVAVSCAMELGWRVPSRQVLPRARQQTHAGEYAHCRWLSATAAESEAGRVVAGR